MGRRKSHQKLNLEERRAKYTSLQAYCETQRQSELFAAIIEHGSVTKAAKALGVRHQTVSKIANKIETKALEQNWRPDDLEHNHTLPATQFLKRNSKFVSYKENPKGEVTGEWIIACAKSNDIANELRDFADALGEQTQGLFKKVPFKKPKGMDPKLTTVYGLADVHLGMLAWSKETREDYDTAIASDAIRCGADLLTAKTPPSKTAIVANLGDFFHFDNDDQQTRSGNILDGDGRWTKIVDLGVECLLYFIQRALEKHETVKVINSVGNHDSQSAAMLPFILKPYFMNEPRVTIEDEPRDHHYHRFGVNLVGFHHGHKTNASRLPMAMVNDQLLNPLIDTEGVENLHWLTGHIHHLTKEYDGCLVESLRALCAKDAYHAGGGYRAGREIQAINYHSEYGEDGRDRVSFKRIAHYSNYAPLKESLTK